MAAQGMQPVGPAVSDKDVIWAMPTTVSCPSQLRYSRNGEDPICIEPAHMPQAVYDELRGIFPPAKPVAAQQSSGTLNLSPLQSDSSTGGRGMPSLCISEPLDVPAIQYAPDDLDDHCYNGRTFKEWEMERRDTKDYTVWSERWAKWPSKACEGKPMNTPLPWTCADKSRILLTAEDGSKHCVKF